MRYQGYSPAETEDRPLLRDRLGVVLSLLAIAASWAWLWVFLATR